MASVASIGARLGASRLLWQSNFNAASDKSPGSAHFQGAMFLVVVAALVAGTLVSLNRESYRAAQALLQRGAVAQGIVESASRVIEQTVGSRKYTTTTVAYRFVGPDQQTYRGVSVNRSREALAAAQGQAIDVRYDLRHPQDNAWQASLQRTVTEARAGVFAALLLLPFVGLMALRYLRWVGGRRWRAALAA